MVLEWTLGLKGLAYSMPDLFAAASVYISREHAWETQTFCMRLVLVDRCLYHSHY